MASSSSPPKTFPRNGFRETMELSRLPDGNDSTTKRFMSRQPAWRPGAELPDGGASVGVKVNAYGGHVYIQAPLTAARVAEEEDESNGAKGKFGIHSIHGVFTNPGLVDRPFIYEVSNITSTRGFSTRQVNVRQPTQPSVNPSGPFPDSDSKLSLGAICFTCVTTFKRPMLSPADAQLASAQERYASILSLKATHEWGPTPQIDMDNVKDAFPNAGYGGFPILDMNKVDMTAFNAGKPVPERRELILYRLHKPLSTDDPNEHILCHAFEADRNGLLMLGNHLGWGYNLGAVASLSYSFYVHVNADEAVMHGDGWWIQEVCWPRICAGRGMMESRIWSPEGKHIATGYQDGITLPRRKKGDNKL